MSIREALCPLPEYKKLCLNHIRRPTVCCIERRKNREQFWDLEELELTCVPAKRADTFSKVFKYGDCKQTTFWTLQELINTYPDEQNACFYFVRMSPR